MLRHLLVVIVALAAQAVQSIAIPLPKELRHNDITYDCPGGYQQWLKVNRSWIQTSTTTGCMALELDPTTIYALNAIPKPNPRGHDYPNLVCMLSRYKCAWTYSPLDAVTSTYDDTDHVLTATRCQMSDVSCRSSPRKVSKAYAHQEGNENCGGYDDDNGSKDSGDTGAGDAEKRRALNVGEGRLYSVQYRDKEDLPSINTDAPPKNTRICINITEKQLVD
ncbi:hypothetical protein LTS15_004419 [Exophiala xenobiotica]|nr:hypothetical protein LTS15_004419 [Exophiala xenobiotica]